MALKQSRVIDATVGQLIFNEPIPQDLGFVDSSDPENDCSTWRSTSYRRQKAAGQDHRPLHHASMALPIATEMLDKVKALGYKYSTRGAITVSVCGYDDPGARNMSSSHEAEAEVVKIDRQYKRGFDHQRRALSPDGQAVGKDDQGRHRRAAGQPGPVQPHLYDGRLRRPWFHEPDPSAGRHARPDGRYHRYAPSRSPSRQTSVKACPSWNTSFPPEAHERA